MNFCLDELNEEQLKPVLDTEGAVLVTAGAGSGKTRLLTHRVAHLIVDNGVPPYRILAITFTNKAAREMQERLMQMLPDTRGIWISTFHSLCVSVLRRYIEKLGGYTSKFSIYGEQEKERLVKEILKDNNEDADMAKKVIDVISDCKNSDIDEEDYLKLFPYDDDAKKISGYFAEYNSRMLKNNALDFDDLILKALLLMRSVPECREYYQDRFRYIHIDEFQDTNTVQYELVKILAARYGNVMVVGDEDQSIYGWRGADIRNIRNFINDFNAKTYKLEQNYRSTKNILGAANVLIKHNAERIDKNLWTENSQGGKVEYYAAPTESSEADFVVRCIAGLVDNGYKLSDIAILMRLNALSRSFEQKFLQYNIPCVVYGGFKFFDRKEIKDVLAYLKIIANHNDEEAILRVINFPKRGIGDGTVAQLRNYAAVNGISLYDAIIGVESNEDLSLNMVKKITPFAAVLDAAEKFSAVNDVYELTRFLIKVLNLRGVYSEPTEENESRKMNIRELLNSIKEFVSANPGADVSQYLQTVSLYSDTDEKNDDNSKITIATVHSAKGLEFKAVFIVGLEEGNFPLSRASESGEELEEERRLMYVAITRAKEKLYLTRARSRFMYGQRKETVISRFVAEAGIDAPGEKPFIGGGRFGRNDDNDYGKFYGNRYSDDLPYDDYAYAENGSSFKKSSGNASYGGGYAKASAPAKQKIDIGAFKEGVTVVHKKFGKGVIVSVEPNNGNTYAVIAFEKIGNMTLALEYAGLKTEEEG